jgi:3-hydroxyisobutyrate dehydrogenase-like beta-hydroxyacid dehydrogenase
MVEGNKQVRVGVIGLGKMGSALADALLARKFETTVWNRTPAKAEPCQKAGAKLARSASEAARCSDVLVVCLADYAALKTTLLTGELGVSLRNKTLVDLTSIKSDELKELVAWADKNGILLLKGTIPGYPADVRAGNCSILYGGPRRAFDTFIPVLQAMGGSPVHIGEAHAAGVEMGRAYYSFLFPALVAFLYGAALCQRAGLSLDTYARGLILPSLKGPVMSGMMERLTKASMARRYDEDVQSTLNIWRGAFDNVIDCASSHRLDPAFLTAAKALMDQAAAEGFGEKDLAAVFETLIRDGR